MSLVIVHDSQAYVTTDSRLHKVQQHGYRSVHATHRLLTPSVLSKLCPTTQSVRIQGTIETTQAVRPTTHAGTVFVCDAVGRRTVHRIW